MPNHTKATSTRAPLPSPNPSGNAPSMPTGPADPAPTPARPLPVPEYWQSKPPLPPSWRADLNAAQLMAVQKVGFDRLRELDKQAATIEQERIFLHAWLATPPLPNS